MKRVLPQLYQRAALIPDFCRWPALIQLLLVMEIVAIILTLAGNSRGSQAVERLLMLSLYMQWIGLSCAAAMCWARSWLFIARPGVVFFVCWGMIVLIVMVIADISYFGAGALGMRDALPPEDRLQFILRHTLIAGLVALLLLRYFWTRHQWQEQIRSEGEARYQALNARIRPHFLFNSLNSLAALIQIRPDDAEHMVEDLSDLFRASLEKRGQVGPLVDEISLCNSYLRIEQLRLGDKLKVEWDVPDELLDWQLPMLVVQPLIENAVHHGVSKLKDSGTVRILARQVDKRLIVEVENPIPPGETQASHGNRIAVDNIAQRLNLLYGEGARFELGRDQQSDGAVFRARIVLPSQLKPADQKT